MSERDRVVDLSERRKQVDRAEQALDQRILKAADEALEADDGRRFTVADLRAAQRQQV